MSVHHVFTAAASVAPPAKDSLTTALTIEGLIFAAFAFAVRLAEPSEQGRNPFFTEAWFGLLVVLVIAAAAVSAGAAWWATYEPLHLSGVNVWLRAGGLVPGIVAPPFFAAAINWQSR
jgi:hypothetical protein